MPNPATVPDDLDSFMAQRRAQSVSTRSDEQSDDDLDAFMASRKASPASGVPRSASSSTATLPHAKPGPYVTSLSPSDEGNFQDWVKSNNVPFDDSPQSDYDMRGYWKAMAAGDKNAKTEINPDDHLPHYPDTYKTPYHKTFSNESMYATPDAPHWEGDKLVPTPTMGPAKLGIVQRIKMAIGAGAPEGSVAANATGQMGTRGTPQLITPEAAMTESEQQRHPVLTGAGEFAGGMTSPDNLLILGLTGGAGELAGPGSQAVKRMLAAGFSLPMLYSAAQQVPGISDAFKKNDYSTALRLMTKAGLTAAAAGLAAHGMGEDGAPTEVSKGTITGPLAVDRAGSIYDDLQQQSRINAPVNVPPTTPAPTILRGRTQGPEPNPLQTEAAQVREQQGNQRADEQAKNPPAFTVRDQRRVRPAGPEELPGHIGPKQEQLAPESSATLKAQTDALANGTNPIVYFPTGSGTIPEPPPNAEVTVVPGEKAGAGTYFHTQDVSSEQIRSSVEDGTFGKLLGYQQPKEEAIAGRAPAAITARDASGTEVKAALADTANPHVVAAQAAELARQFPDAKIAVEPAEHVVSERLGKTPQGAENTSPASVSRDTPQAQKATESANATPADLKPILEHHGLDLFVQARQLQRLDPELAQRLSDFADGKYHTPADLQKLVRGINDKNTKADLTKILADYSAATEAVRGNGGANAEGNESASRGVLEVHGSSETVRGTEAQAGKTRNALTRSGVPRSAPRMAATKSQVLSRFSPDVLEAAKHEIGAASELASSFERPGRYFSAVGQTDAPIIREDPKAGVRHGGTWYGVGSSRHMVADQFPWFADMKGGAGKLADLAARSKGAEYERLVATVAEQIQREKESAAPVIAEFAPKLRSLSDEIDGNDPDLSELLKQVASGDGRGFRNLRQYFEEKVEHGERARDFFKSIDDTAAEARQAGSPESTDEAGGLRERTGGELAEGTEAHTTERASQGSEFFTPETVKTKARAEEQNALPGFESAIDEQRAGAERVRGEQLSGEARRPLGNIDEAAGEMERRSPLFRDSEANPQRNLLHSRVAVGDRIEPTTGPLKGQRLEVTKVGDTGVYARQGEGPIKFVSNSDLADLAEGRTLFANPLPAVGAGARMLSRAWNEKLARPLIDRVLKIGDKYLKVREEDPAIAEGLHLLDNAPVYLRAKAAQEIQNVIGTLSRAQERLFTLMADADSRQNLRANHPQEFAQAQRDSAIQAALRKYKPLEQELTSVREKMGGETLDQDYLRRVYEKHVAGVNKPTAEGKPAESTPSQFDRVIRPQGVNAKSREASAEYHYQNGLHEFGPAFATKYVATHLKALRDEVAQEFLSKATTLPHGAVEPSSIDYGNARFYRPDIARDMREAGTKSVKEYGYYDPTQGERFPTPAEGRYLGPKEITNALTDYGRKEETEPGGVRRFFQEQVLGFGFGVPHVFNILRRVTQNTEGGAANPVAWVRALKVAFGKELRSRGMKGLNDPTFDMLAKHGAISTGEGANLKKYIGGNLNPANWLRGIAQVGHKALFEPGSFKGFGGIDQRARLYVADLVRSQRPELSDTEVSRAVNDALGEYSRANWTDRQKLLGRFMMFPGWDFASLRWVLQHPIRTTVPPAILTLLANRALHSMGQNRSDDQNDISAIHIGDRAFSTGLLRESMARNLFRPALNYAQSKINGENSGRALDQAARGFTSGAGGLLSTVRPDLSGFFALAANRQNLFSGKELLSKSDFNAPGRILPSKALENLAVFTVRHSLPAVDRMLDSNEDVDLRSFAGGNLGFPNYKDDAEKRLIRNAAEASRVSQTVSRLAKTNPAQARQFLKDPDNATYAIFRNDIASLEKALHTVEQSREVVESSKLPDAVKQQRLQALDKVRTNVLSHADGLNNLLFNRRMAKRSGVPMTAPAAGNPAYVN